MNNYKITEHTKKQARALGVEVKPSTVKNKKIDVFKNGEKLASVGALGYNDYGGYLKINKELAEQKRKNYKARHEKDRKKKDTPSYWADRLLW